MRKRGPKYVLGRVNPRWRPFYRRFRFDSPVSIRSADARGCVDQELGIFYNRIPKAANSTVVINLAAEQSGRDIGARAAKKLFATPAELSRAEVAAFDSLLRFTFVRNPYHRVLSAYLDKVERKARMKNETSSFEDFLGYLGSGGLYRNMHWAPQHALLLIPFNHFDFVGRVEHLEQDLAHVLALVRGDPPDGEAAHDDYSNRTGASRRIAEYYTPRIRERVWNLYREDFRTFGYDDALEV